MVEDKKKMHIALRFVIMLSVALFMVGCSARVAYDSPAARSSETAININTGSVKDLEKLPGIGRKTAEAIVEHRSSHGPFRRVEQLMLIRGVSEKRFVEIRSFVTID